MGWGERYPARAVCGGGEGGRCHRGIHRLVGWEHITQVFLRWVLPLPGNPPELGSKLFFTGRVAFPVGDKDVDSGLRFCFIRPGIWVHPDIVVGWVHICRGPCTDWLVAFI